MIRLQILGTGCPKCRKLTENAEAAARELGLDYEMGKVTAVAEIAKFGVMLTPALAVDGVVRVFGTVPDVAAIKEMLSDASAGGCTCAGDEKGCCR